MAAEGRWARARRLMGTVRFRVTALATLAVLAVLVVTGGVLVVAQRRTLTSGVDEAVERRSDEVAALVQAGDLPPRLTGGDDLVAQVVDADGRVVAASPELAGEAPLGPMPSATGEDAAVTDTVDGLPVEDGPFRVRSVAVAGPDGTVAVHAAGALDDVDESVAALLGALAVVIPAAALLLAALVWWLVGRTLQPVEAIRAEVASIGGPDLHRRVPVPPTDDEVGRLARTMNAMLDRVEGAVDRQQRFVADASHELRSPLARMRAEVEVDLAHPQAADPLATHRSVLAEVAALQALVADLLYLARADAGAAPPRPEPVDLDDVVLRGAAELRLVGRVRVDTSGVGPVQVLGRADQLARAVGNLADNAARHARSTVAFTLATDGDGHAVLAVADDGPGIPPEDRDRVFERFTRLDPSRDARTGGIGLGLAIARDVVERHGGTIAVDPGHTGGARLVISLPLAPNGA
jgi:signal transduction histidine kinase